MPSPPKPTVLLTKVIGWFAQITGRETSCQVWPPSLVRKNLFAEPAPHRAQAALGEAPHVIRRMWLA